MKQVPYSHMVPYCSRVAIKESNRRGVISYKSQQETQHPRKQMKFTITNTLTFVLLSSTVANMAQRHFGSITDAPGTSISKMIASPPSIQPYSLGGIPRLEKQGRRRKRRHGNRRRNRRRARQAKIRAARARNARNAKRKADARSAQSAPPPAKIEHKATARSAPPPATLHSETVSVPAELTAQMDSAEDAPAEEASTTEESDSAEPPVEADKVSSEAPDPNERSDSPEPDELQIEADEVPAEAKEVSAGGNTKADMADTLKRLLASAYEKALTSAGPKIKALDALLQSLAVLEAPKDLADSKKALPSDIGPSTPETNQAQSTEITTSDYHKALPQAQALQQFPEIETAVEKEAESSDLKTSPEEDSVMTPNSEAEMAMKSAPASIKALDAAGLRRLLLEAGLTKEKMKSVMKFNRLKSGTEVANPVITEADTPEASAPEVSLSSSVAPASPPAEADSSEINADEMKTEAEESETDETEELSPESSDDEEEKVAVISDE
jgi:hypothetical protein